MDLIKVGARASKLSIKQVDEIEFAIRYHHPNIALGVLACKAKGDLDQKTSLKDLGRTDFFTYEIDQWLLHNKCRIAIHSAKDLPENLNEEFQIVAITEALNSEDVIVFHPDADLALLPKNLVIATSSKNREENARGQYPHAKIVDLRGTIEKRLQKVLNREVDGVIIAKVALMRLGYTHLNIAPLKGPTTPLQGSLAIVARKGDKEMKELFSSIDSRAQEKSLYFGLNAQKYYSRGKVFHCPLIQIEPLPKEMFSDLKDWLRKSTYLILTSQMSVKILLELLEEYQISKNTLKDKKIIAVGLSTSSALQKKGCYASYIAREESQEGIAKTLDHIPFKEKDFVFYPKSSEARKLLEEYLIAKNLPHKVMDLYRPKRIPLKEKPKLDQYDEIVFTSPSTIDSFFENFDAIPSHLRVVYKGKVTRESLQKALEKPLEVSKVVKKN